MLTRVDRPGQGRGGGVGVGAAGRACAPNSQWRVCLPPGAARPRHQAASTGASGAMAGARGWGCGAVTGAWQNPTATVDLKRARARGAGAGALRPPAPAPRWVLEAVLGRGGVAD